MGPTLKGNSTDNYAEKQIVLKNVQTATQNILTMSKAKSWQLPRILTHFATRRSNKISIK